MYNETNKYCIEMNDLVFSNLFMQYKTNWFVHVDFLNFSKNKMKDSNGES